MKDDMPKAAVCPLCGKTYRGRPALSRTDNKTLICPDCGTRQALSLIGVGKEEREEILRIIHAHGGGNAVAEERAAKNGRNRALS